MDFWAAIALINTIACLLVVFFLCWLLWRIVKHAIAVDQTQMLNRTPTVRRVVGKVGKND